VLPYGKEKQTLFMDAKPSKAIWNPKWSGFFTKSFKGLLSKHKVQWLDLASCLWLALIGLLSADSIKDQHPKMVKYSKSPLNSSSPNYLWFMQYNDNNCGDVGNAQSTLDKYYVHWISLVLPILINY
jgi:hypothetical protein